jgi:hypothetical protein
MRQSEDKRVATSDNNNSGWEAGYLGFANSTDLTPPMNSSL